MAWAARELNNDIAPYTRTRVETRQLDRGWHLTCKSASSLSELERRRQHACVPAKQEPGSSHDASSSRGISTSASSPSKSQDHQHDASLSSELEPKPPEVVSRSKPTQILKLTKHESKNQANNAVKRQTHPGQKGPLLKCSVANAVRNNIQLEGAGEGQAISSPGVE
ncbi:hypothetical protein M405DRAFT_845790 [Rhizopogon salebrosus TDB-379]|nr:hypothetical protein M405DRAFT_845790 [Rhizopogon salebrosus TDB-379]